MELKPIIETAVQRTIEKITPYGTERVNLYIVESPNTSEQLPKRHWMVYEFPDFIACVPEGGKLCSDYTKTWNKPYDSSEQKVIDSKEELIRRFHNGEITEETYKELAKKYE